MRSAICISGLARSYRKTFPSFVRNVLEPLRERGPVDIFISIWDTEDLRALSPRGMAEEPKVDLEDIASMYEPVALDVEQYAPLHASFHISRFVPGGEPAKGVIKDGVLTAAPAQYKVLRCNELRHVHEQLIGQPYDLVVRTRFDVEITRLDVDALDLTKVNCLYDHDGVVGDYLYIANGEVMTKVSRLFVHYPVLLSIPGTDMGPERNLKNHLDRLGLQTHIMRGHTFALVRDTFRQEYRWDATEAGYRPYTPMIICSALYYPGSLAHPETLVRDNRFYPGKAVETFLPWYQYLRKHYPTDHLVLFADTASPVPIQPLLDALPESYDTFTGYLPSVDAQPEGARVHVKWLSEHSGKYFWPMQRNLVEGLLVAYHSGQNLFWVDNDAFLNTDVRPQVRDADLVAANIAAHQMTMDSVCFYISSRRLHALDELGIDLPTYLLNMLNNAPSDTRMHSLQEGGLYKTFCYGNARAIPHINLSHLSCLPRFLRFLRENPLDTPEYRALLAALEGFDLGRIPGVETSFQDMLHTEADGRVA